MFELKIAVFDVDGVIANLPSNIKDKNLYYTPKNLITRPLNNKGVECVTDSIKKNFDIYFCTGRFHRDVTYRYLKQNLGHLMPDGINLYTRSDKNPVLRYFYKANNIYNCTIKKIIDQKPGYVRINIYDNDRAFLCTIKNLLNVFIDLYPTRIHLDLFLVVRNDSVYKITNKFL